jgi:hypothetical protein
MNNRETDTGCEKAANALASVQVGLGEQSPSGPKKKVAMNSRFTRS